MKNGISTTLFILVFCIGAVCPIVGGILFFIFCSAGLIDWKP